jgi:hypothetical protein
VGECRGWDLETELLSCWCEHQALFPRIPSQSRFNRRRRNLQHAFNRVHQAVLQLMEVAQDPQCLIDSLPVPVVKFHLVPGATGAWREQGADFGRVSSKKQTIFSESRMLSVGLAPHPPIPLRPQGAKGETRGVNPSPRASSGRDTRDLG